MKRAEQAKKVREFSHSLCVESVLLLAGDECILERLVEDSINIGAGINQAGLDQQTDCVTGVGGTDECGRGVVPECDF